MAKWLCTIPITINLRLISRSKNHFLLLVKRLQAMTNNTIETTKNGGLVSFSYPWIRDLWQSGQNYCLFVCWAWKQLYQQDERRWRRKRRLLKHKETLRIITVHKILSWAVKDLCQSHIKIFYENLNNLSMAFWKQQNRFTLSMSLWEQLEHDLI